MHLGEKLKIYRRSKDLDQPEMADLVGVAYRTYQEIERTGIVTKSKVQERIREILDEKKQISADDTQNLVKEPAVDYSKHEPLTRQEISEMIHTNKMQAEAILHLSRAISSNVNGSTSSRGSAEGTGNRTDLSDAGLSGKRKRSGQEQEPE